MDPKQLNDEINRLTVTQKLILTQDIWDSIARESAQVPLPEWQKNELEKRYSQYQQGGMELHDWQETHNKLRTKHP